MATVLVVDDDPDIRTMLSLALADAGYAVATAVDGPSALQAVGAEPPDLLVLDVMMPGVDGFGVLRELRRQGLVGAMRIMLLTCKSEERDFVQGWELGAHEYLTKPFDPETLVTKAAGLLAARGDELVERRQDELQKADLLQRLEGALGRGRSRG